MQKPSNLTIAFALCGLAWLVIVGRSIFLEQPKRDVIATQAELDGFAKAKLNSLQSRSFDRDREFCGLIFEDGDGELSASDSYEGTEGECQFSWTVPWGKYAVATFHTHGGFNDEYDSEAPSLLDLETDLEDRIDGYISTPGGRIWHIDWQDETASQLCGAQCVEQDPRYESCMGFMPVRTYSLAALQTRVEQGYQDCR